MIVKLRAWPGHNSLVRRWKAQWNLLLRPEVPHHILAFAFSAAAADSHDPNFRGTPRPVFRGAGGDPALQHAALLRPVREQWSGLGGDFSCCSDLIPFFFFFFFPPLSPLPLRRSGLRLVIAAACPERGCVNVRKAVQRLRLRGNGLISACFPSSSASTKLR